jgi:hypothetical protein
VLLVALFWPGVVGTVPPVPAAENELAVQNDVLMLRIWMLLRVGFNSDSSTLCPAGMAMALGGTDWGVRTPMGFGTGVFPMMLGA